MRYGEKFEPPRKRSLIRRALLLSPPYPFHVKEILTTGGGERAEENDKGNLSHRIRSLGHAQRKTPDPAVLALHKSRPQVCEIGRLRPIPGK